MVHHAEEDAMTTFENVSHDEEDDAVAAQSFSDGEDDGGSRSSFLLNTFNQILLNTFNQLASNTQDQSRLLFLAYYLLDMLLSLLEIFHTTFLQKTNIPEDQVENTPQRGASNDTEQATQKIQELLGCEIGHEL